MHIWVFLLVYDCTCLTNVWLETEPTCTQRVALFSRVAQVGGAWNPLRAVPQFGTIRQSAMRTTDAAKTHRTEQLASQPIQIMHFPPLPARPMSNMPVSQRPSEVFFIIHCCGVHILT